MKQSTLSALLVSMSLLLASGAQADEVLSTVHDNTAGKSVDALTGVMVGGAAGGPLGELVGAGIGWLAGACRKAPVSARTPTLFAPQMVKLG